MLHAELHGKLAADASNHERREDILTSTVFGTLVVAGAVEVLAEWLGQAVALVADGKEEGAEGWLDASGVDGNWKVWFWPRLREAEPDVVVRLGDRLLVVEAKYLSGASVKAEKQIEDGHGPDCGGDAADDGARMEAEAVGQGEQLERQWRSVTSEPPDHPPELRDACREGRHVIVYLVTARRRHRSAADLLDAGKRVGDGFHGRLLTWEDLHRVLYGRVQRHRQAGTVPPDWMVDLMRLLERRGLGAFAGFKLVLAEEAMGGIARLAEARAVGLVSRRSPGRDRGRLRWDTESASPRGEPGRPTAREDRGLVAVLADGWGATPRGRSWGPTAAFAGLDRSAIARLAGSATEGRPHAAPRFLWNIGPAHAAVAALARGFGLASEARVVGLNWGWDGDAALVEALECSLDHRSRSAVPWCRVMPAAALDLVERAVRNQGGPPKGGMR